MWVNGKKNNVPGKKNKRKLMKRGRRWGDGCKIEFVIRKKKQRGKGVIQVNGGNTRIPDKKKWAKGRL